MPRPLRLCARAFLSFATMVCLLAAVSAAFLEVQYHLGRNQGDDYRLGLVFNDFGDAVHFEHWSNGSIGLVVPRPVSPVFGPDMFDSAFPTWIASHEKGDFNFRAGRFTMVRAANLWLDTGSGEPPASYHGHVYLAFVPYWFVLVVSAVLPIRAFARRRVRRTRARRGLCTTCGYDLRVSHDRCPECGAAAQS